MTIDSFDALFLTLAFLVPGFVVQSMIAVSIPRRQEESHLTFLRFLTYSCINYALWSWLIFLLHSWWFFKDHTIRSAIGWGFVILVGPALLGLALGYLQSRDIIRGAMQRLGLAPIHVIPTAWDWKFSRTKQPVWVLVTLKDGTQIRGLFGSHSFASSDPDERDLFIEQAYTVQNDRWMKWSRTDGILIAGDQIKHIEYINAKETANG